MNPIVEYVDTFTKNIQSNLDDRQQLKQAYMKAIAFGYRKVKTKNLSFKEINHKYFLFQSCQYISVALMGFVSYSSYRTIDNFSPKNFLHFSIAIIPPVILYLTFNFFKKGMLELYATLAKFKTPPEHINIIDNFITSNIHISLLNFSIHTGWKDVITTETKKTITKIYNECDQNQIQEHIRELKESIKTVTHKDSLIVFFKGVQNTCAQGCLEKFITEKKNIIKNRMGVKNSMLLFNGINNPNHNLLLSNSIIGSMIVFLEKMSVKDYEKNYSKRMKKTLTECIDSFVLNNNKSPLQTINDQIKKKPQSQNTGKITSILTEDKHKTTDQLIKSNINTIYSKHEVSKQKKNEVLKKLHIICHKLHERSHKDWLYSCKKINEIYTQQELISFLKQLNFSHNFIHKNLLLLMQQFLPLKNYELLNEFAINSRIQKFGTINTLADIDRISTLISNEITTTDIPEDNIKLYLLTKYFLSIDQVNNQNNDYCLDSKKTELITDTEVKKQELIPPKKKMVLTEHNLEPSTIKNQISFHGGKQHIINTLGRDERDQRIIKKCLDKIERRFDPKEQQNKKFNTSLIYVDTNDLHRIYHISLGIKDSNCQTMTLFFIKKSDCVQIIATGRHITNNMYSILWSTPSIAFPGVVSISEEQNILNK